MCSHPSAWSPMYCVERILLLIAASAFLAEVVFSQGTTITSLNTTDTAGTPTSATVTGASAPSSFAGPLTLNYLGGDRTLSSYVTSAGTFEAVQVAGIVTLRRNVSEPTPTNNIVWNFITSQPSATTYNLAGPFVGQESV